METIDTLIQDRHLQMLKAALPYVDNTRQKSIAMMVKFMELQRTMALFESPENNLRMCSQEEDQSDAPLQMLNAIREYCTEKEQEMIDNMMTFVQMFSTYGTLFA